jgi:hypothetical protein
MELVVMLHQAKDMPEEQPEVDGVPEVAEVPEPLVEMDQETLLEVEE